MKKFEARAAERWHVPFFATMFLCHALKANGRPCHAYASVLEEVVDRTGTPVITYSHTCRHHRSFFEGTRWKEKYLGDIWYREIWQVPHLHIEYVLSSGAVDVTRADVEGFEPRGCTWYLFVLLARHVPAACRDWNPTLWEKAQTVIWHRIDSIGPVPLDYIDLRQTICQPFAQELALCLKRFPAATHRREMLKEEWLTAVKLLLILGDAEEILTDPQLTAETFQLARRPDLLCLNSMIDGGEILDLLLTERAALYKKKIAGVNVDAFREELLAVAWEPSRAVAWCFEFDFRQT